MDVTLLRDWSASYACANGSREPEGKPKNDDGKERATDKTSQSPKYYHGVYACEHADTDYRNDNSGDRPEFETIDDPRDDCKIRSPKHTCWRNTANSSKSKGDRKYPEIEAKQATSCSRKDRSGDQASANQSCNQKADISTATGSKTADAQACCKNATQYLDRGL
ncbi:hypothetical protein SLS60_004637 [Paraconiothyrium brasiliense]|uniref:Uncharacterized protein n=1 Tax=Paraconiothyrium brasiliense TaxID=300254 RepID=A0ABR3RKX0_9PLEO